MTMETNLPTAICSTDHFYCVHGFTKLNIQLFVSFEDLPESSEERLTLELSASESLYADQLEISTELIKRKFFIPSTEGARQ